MRLFVVVSVWAAAFYGLSTYGTSIFPRALLGELTLEAYLALIQILTLGIGLGAAFALLDRPDRVLPLRASTPRALLVTGLLAPLVFSVSTTVAFFVARPTLIAEILAGGTELAQKNTGRFGRELVESPAALALVWGAVISPVGEEMFFRGALWSFVQGVVERFSGSQESENEGPLPSDLLEPSFLERGLRASGRWLFGGGATTILVGLLFGFLHRDMPGGLGIVRFVSALGLGLACGIARQSAGSLAAAITLHALYNALSLATVRRWVVSETFPTRYGAPTLITLIGVVGLVAAIVASRASGLNKRG